MAQFLARREQFAVVGSTNDVVRGWLAAGTPEVCLAVADEQSAGRGRDGRTWIAPAGGALLLSLGFRPTWIPPDRVWRLAAVVSLAMAGAAEDIGGMPDGTIRLKWPNDLVVERARGSSGEWLAVRKLAGVLGETDGLGGPDPRAIIGIGMNTDWPAGAFPPELADSMTSLHEISDGGGTDHEALLDAFLRRLEVDIEGLRTDRFDADAWADRQLTTGREVELIAPDGAVTTVRGLGVDGTTGGLIVEDDGATSGRRQVLVGEIKHVRLPAVGEAAPASPARAGV
jgi:BirA family transcriptional regulator, biotin operon repressor / biotin---[acetyl-CoA-carboxylase] ligase